MADCTSKIAKGIVNDCSAKPKGGIVRKWAINWDDIDHEANEYTHLKNTVTRLTLKVGGQVYPMEGNDKTSDARQEFVKGDFFNGYRHFSVYRPLTNTGVNREEMQKVIDGGRIVTIEETLNKGELRYEIVGLEVGMTAEDDPRDLRENSSLREFTVATPEDELEDTGIKILDIDDTGGTSTWIESNVFTPAT